MHPALSREPSLSSDPITQFHRWFEQARRTEGLELAEAMCLSTVNAKGKPSARMVLLKDVDRNGFTFYTNGLSPKGQDLICRPHAALTFHWRPLRRQVRIEGTVRHVPKKVADAYFATRPRLSQIGSWASDQSQPLKSRNELLKRLNFFAARFKGKKVPAPLHWQGFCVAPETIEFWQEQPNRLHDRWLYERQRSGGWGRKRLYP